MTSVAATAPAHGVHHAPMSFWRKYIFSTDHKIIGIQFLFVSLFFLLVGGVLAMQMRWALGFPGQPMPGGGLLPETKAAEGVLLPEYYVELVSMHGTFMVFFAIMPLLVGVSLRAMDMASEAVGAKRVGYRGPRDYIDALETFRREVGNPG